MAFFDELGKVISDKSKEAANRVKDITGVLQLKSRLSAEKDKINKAYITLGKAYYDKHEAEAEDIYASEFQTIQAGLVKIASLEDEIAELEGTRVCAECGAKVEKDAAFCSKCGAPMDTMAASDSREETSEPETPEHADDSESSAEESTSEMKPVCGEACVEEDAADKNMDEEQA